MSQSSLINNFIAVAIILIAWHLLSMYIAVPLIIPDVISIFSALGGLLSTLKFWNSFYHTMLILISSYISGLILTFGIILLIFKNKFLQSLFEKYSSYFMPLPSFVVLPFMSLFLGLSAKTMYSIIIWTVVWNSGIQIMRAIQTVNNTWEPQIKNLGWSFSYSFRHVYLPAAAYNIMGIISTSWANSWRVLISLETVFGSIGGYFGLGSYIMDTKSKLDVDQMYATLFVIAVTGVVIDSILKYFKNRFSY
jgi:ABC-type nitrate/sulfonate/bicarbonate transport system permease component